MPAPLPATAERVDRLEASIDRFIASVGIEFNKLYKSQQRTEAEMREFKDEMREFKDEMREFKDEMREFKDEMREFKDEMLAFKDEMSGFKDEMLGFKAESIAERREMNRKWGDLANKLGTMVEDLVYPSLPRILRETLGREFDSIQARVRLRLPDGRVREFDAFAIAPDVAALNSTKATLRSADVDRLIDEIAAFREFLPARAHLPVVGILATLSVDDSVLNYAERLGFLVLAVGDQVMEVKNRPGFEPRFW
ncbi:hypothetical protein [uncultured Thiodictyon sp.]|jgi:hypothetical protein|uniref:hypothetical protein n=1 Tax=uncultured Thiodictyon sp. TaxID=1846217 RepID=UPI0025EA7B41|nr:hypothetical protein [uncultured Thiodictyon sp.]